MLELTSALVYLLLICEHSNGSNGESSLYAQIPSTMHHLCPGIDVCSSNHTLKIEHVKRPVPGVTSCCTECSCSADCSKTGNCCFPNTSTQIEEPSNSLYGRSCIYPMLPQPAELLHKYQSYLMVSSVRRQDKTNGWNEQSNISCGDMVVAPWGSLYPVYSTQSKQVYKNIECAKEDGEKTDVVISSDAVIKCKGNKESQGISLADIGLQTNTIPESCSIVFFFSGRPDILQPFKCFTNLIDTCPESQNFNVPEGLNISKDDIRTLCEKSGIVSPFRMTDMYANVFCHICNEHDEFNRNVACQSTSIYTFMKSSISGKFIALIDGNFAIASKSHQTIIKKAFPVACFINEVTRCRELFCPTGQLRDGMGKCVYLSKIWYNQKYGLILNLTLYNYMHVSKLMDHVYKEPHLRSIWMQKWLIHSMYYKVMDDPLMSDSVVIKLQRTLAEVEPNLFVRNIKKMIRSAWTVRVYTDENITLSAALSKYISFTHNPPPTMMHRFGNLTTERLKQQRYEQVYKSSQMWTKPHVITKLYFCDQVELHPSEFLLNEEKSILYSFTTKRYMFDGEFALVYRQVSGDYRARICIDDSGFYSALSNNVGTALKRLEACQVLAYALCIFIQISIYHR